MKILIVFISLFLFACSPVRSGKIVDKIYKSPWTETCYNYVNIGDVLVPIPYSVDHPARYTIKLQATVDGKVKDGYVDVSPESYHKLEVGQFYGLEQ